MKSTPPAGRHGNHGSAAATPRLDRRRVVSLTVSGAALAAAALGLPALALARTPLPRMTDGPFYPSRDWRSRSLDWDADLTQVRGNAPDGQPRQPARGEGLDLFGAVVDENGRPIDKVEVEIWQCDAFGSYRHPRDNATRVDDGFQGFGSSVSDGSGRFRFRTIRPAPYPGRTPHIHVKLRHPSFRERTSQLFVAGDPGNARDFLWGRLSAEDRAACEMRLRPAAAGEPVKWQVEMPLVVG